MSRATRRDGIVGRNRELRGLRSWLEAARGGTGRVVFCVGEPGIGKTRLAQELAGLALAGGTAVAWGRCVETEGAPAFWPWRQVLRSMGVDPDPLLSPGSDSPEERFRVVDEVSEAVIEHTGEGGLVVVLDDIHWADEPSLLALRHLADKADQHRMLVLATFRDVEPARALEKALPELLRASTVERLELRGFGLLEVGEQLAATGADSSEADARAVLDLTSGNPLFVREVARAMADGTWRPDRPPRTVLDVVGARLGRVSPACRRFVQAAAIVGRDFSVALVAAALDEPADACLPLVDEAVVHGLVEQIDDAGGFRFVHALTREAVEASLPSTDRVRLHRAVAQATEALFASDLSEHLSDIARHWSQVAPYGEGQAARMWTVRAADDAVHRLAYEEGVRLYRSALAVDPATLTDGERGRLLIALGRAAYLAGDLPVCVEAAVAAADAAQGAGDAELAAEAALVLEATADAGANAVARQLCEKALAGLGGGGHEGLRARLLAQRSHLAFYDGNHDQVEALSSAALELAHASGDWRALVEALHARKEAHPGPNRRADRMALASEMFALAPRAGNPRTALWGALWRIEALIEGGELAAAAEALPDLEAAARRVGGPVSSWHVDRVAACIAQAQGRFGEAGAKARRGLARMSPVEPAPARGAYFALHCALAGHIGVTEEAAPFVEHAFEPLPRFKTMARLSRSFLLLRAGRAEEAAVSYEQTGPLEQWSPPAFFMAPCYVFATLAAIELGRADDVAALADRLEPFRGAHAAGDGVLSLGPVELTLGRAATALGRLDAAVGDLSAAVKEADRAGARGFAAEARYHLATSLLARGGPGDRDRARARAQEADRLARALGMTAYAERTSGLVTHIGSARPAALTRREEEVARLVAQGLTNRQVAERLVISERTAQNHVQHILTKLGFTTRSQIAAWSAGVPR